MVIGMDDSIAIIAALLAPIIGELMRRLLRVHRRTLAFGAPKRGLFTNRAGSRGTRQQALQSPQAGDFCPLASAFQERESSFMGLPFAVLQ
jgi:hypothetical protein